MIYHILSGSEGTGYIPIAKALLKRIMAVGVPSRTLVIGDATVAVRWQGDQAWIRITAGVDDLVYMSRPDRFTFSSTTLLPKKATGRAAPVAPTGTNGQSLSVSLGGGKVLSADLFNRVGSNPSTYDFGLYVTPKGAPGTATFTGKLETGIQAGVATRAQFTMVVLLTYAGQNKVLALFHDATNSSRPTCAYSTDRGATWHTTVLPPDENGLTYQFVEGVYYLGDNTVVARAWGKLGGVDTVMVVKTTDGGQSWTLHPYATPTFRRVDFIASGKNRLVALDNEELTPGLFDSKPRTLRVSSDGGETWSSAIAFAPTLIANYTLVIHAQAAAEGELLVTMLRVDPFNFLGGLNPAWMLRSKDEGQTWEEFTPYAGFVGRFFTPPLVVRPAADGKSFLVAVFHALGSNAQHLYASNDSGATWSRRTKIGSLPLDSNTGLGLNYDSPILAIAPKSPPVTALPTLHKVA